MHVKLRIRQMKASWARQRVLPIAVGVFMGAAAFVVSIQYLLVY